MSQNNNDCVSDLSGSSCPTNVDFIASLKSGFICDQSLKGAGKLPLVISVTVASSCSRSKYIRIPIYGSVTVEESKYSLEFMKSCFKGEFPPEIDTLCKTLASTFDYY